MSDKKADDRMKRLAQRLRDNLRRRKQRARPAEETGGEGGAGKGPTASRD